MPAVPSAAPASFALVLPDGWWSLDLDPDATPSSAAALVEQQWRGVDNAPHLKAQARAELLERAQDARDAGGSHLYLSVGRLGGVPLSAALLVCPLEAGGPDALAGLAARHPDAAWVDLPAGRAVRRQWRQPARPSGADGAVTATTCLDLQLAVPGAEDRLLLLSFRTPLEPLAEPLVALFDAIASTLRWTDRPS